MTRLVALYSSRPGSGKSTVANTVDHKLHAAGKRTFVLDGDNVRMGLNKNLGFSAEDRAENIRRIGCVADIFCSSGMITLTAFVSPYQSDRDRVRAMVIANGNDSDFVEVFVDTPLEICEQRDPKGLYAKARAGELKGFTGIDAPYESPPNPEVHLDGSAPVEKIAQQVIEYLESKDKLKR